MHRIASFFYAKNNLDVKVSKKGVKNKWVWLKEYAE